MRTDLFTYHKINRKKWIRAFFRKDYSSDVQTQLCVCIVGYFYSMYVHRLCQSKVWFFSPLFFPLLNTAAGCSHDLISCIWNSAASLHKSRFKSFWNVQRFHFGMRLIMVGLIERTIHITHSSLYGEMFAIMNAVLEKKPKTISQNTRKKLIKCLSLLTMCLMCWFCLTKACMHCVIR